MKLIVFTMLGFAVFAIAWYYVPEPTRKKVVNFTGKAVEHEAGELPALAKNEFLPQTPAEKIEILIGELQTNLEKIKTANEPATVLEAEKLLEELKQANKETPKITDKILDRILPAKQICEPVEE